MTLSLPRHDQPMGGIPALFDFVRMQFGLVKGVTDKIETIVSISTMDLAKGLEFRAVAVMACDDEIIPSQERIETRSVAQPGTLDLRGIFLETIPLGRYCRVHR